MNKNFKARIIELLWERSLDSSISEQKLQSLSKDLSAIVPDISKQYSSFTIDKPYLMKKVRYLHAFQISLLRDVLEKLGDATIVDIGDSSGTHLQYISRMYSRDKNIRCLSVNMDQEAVKKIQDKGFKAVCARAENLQDYNIDADIFFCFELLEHLSDPSHFLHELATKTKAQYLIITVPYMRKSRMGLHHIRAGHSADVSAENTHLFELNPEDWKLLIKHSGWGVVEERIYWQYPKRNIFYFTKPLWKKFDYEGFYGLVLARNDTWSSKYSDW